MNRYTNDDSDTLTVMGITLGLIIVILISTFVWSGNKKEDDPIVINHDSQAIIVEDGQTFNDGYVTYVRTVNEENAGAILNQWILDHPTRKIVGITSINQSGYTQGILIYHEPKGQ